MPLPVSGHGERYRIPLESCKQAAPWSVACTDVFHAHGPGACKPPTATTHVLSALSNGMCFRVAETKFIVTWPKMEGVLSLLVDEFGAWFVPDHNPERPEPIRLRSASDVAAHYQKVGYPERLHVLSESWIRISDVNGAQNFFGSCDEFPGSSALLRALGRIREPSNAA